MHGEGYADDEMPSMGCLMRFPAVLGSNLDARLHTIGVESDFLVGRFTYPEDTHQSRQRREGIGDRGK